MTSYYRRLMKDDIRAEYDASATRFAEDYRKGKWGSEASMNGRFLAAMRLVDFAGVKRWLDVGCGPGAFFAVVLRAHGRFSSLVGMDISPCMIEEARKKTFPPFVSFVVRDIADIPETCDFDLVTMTGVLQQCAMTPKEALSCARKALRPGGLLYFTTKHMGWEEFVSGRLEPERSHSWFDMEELREALRQAGFGILREGGLLPATCEFTEPERSHTAYFLAERA